MSTLADTLISPIDVVRHNLHTILGDRPYIVYLVKRKWDGGNRGIGNVTEVSRVQVDPVPLISNATDLQAQESGLDEIGTINISEVSLSYNQDALTGGSLAVDEEFFWEVQYDSGNTRRYKPVGMPVRDIAGNFGYKLILTRISDAE